MKGKDLEFSESARAKIVNGVTTLAKAVKATLGPRGRNVVIEKKGASPHVTKDGVTVAKSIDLKDSFENIGAQMVKEVALKTADVSGDGTTTGTILAEAILREGMKLVAADHDPMSLKRGIDKAVEVVVEELANLSSDVAGVEEVRQVATISANGDSKIGDLIAEAMTLVGKEGVITLEEGKTSDSELSHSKGYEFDRGALSPHFIPQGSKSLVFENPLLWVVNSKLTGKQMLDAMLPVFEHASGEGRPIVLIAESIEGDILQTMLVNHLRQTLKCVAIKAPGFGDRRKEMLGDIAALSGATLRDETIHGTGLKLVDQMTVDELGSVDRIEVFPDRTVIVAKEDASSLIESRVAEIRAQLEEMSDTWDVEMTKKRLAKLVGGVAVISVGAPTEIEMKERKDRLEDALAATRAAIEEGIVPGGGVALLRASKALEGFSTGNTEEDFGVKIVANAASMPLTQIVINAGGSPEVVLNDVVKEVGSMGYNAATGQMSDLLKDGVVDPKKVTRVALQNAASIAGLMLTTECVVALEPEEDETGLPGMM